MSKARILRLPALEALRESIAENLEIYRAGDFGHLLVDHSLYFETIFELDTDRLMGLLAPNDGELNDVANCQICYAALPDLTPYEARDERLWAYLTHTYILDYSRRRWQIPAEPLAAVAHVRAHFFAKEQRQIERDNAASRLWWMAHLCRRVAGLSVAESLRVLLFRTDVRASIIERPSISQNLNLFGALIRMLQVSYTGRKVLFERNTFRHLMQEINSVGGYQLLDAMPEEEIGVILDGIVREQLQITDL